MYSFLITLYFWFLPFLQLFTLTSRQQIFFLFFKLSLFTLPLSFVLSILNFKNFYLTLLSSILPFLKKKKTTFFLLTVTLSTLSDIQLHAFFMYEHFIALPFSYMYLYYFLYFSTVSASSFPVFFSFLFFSTVFPSSDILYHYPSFIYSIFFIFLQFLSSFLVTLGEFFFFLPFSTVFPFFCSYYSFFFIVLFCFFLLCYHHSINSLFIQFCRFYLHLFLKLTNTEAFFILTSRCPVATTVMACAMRVFQTL